MSGFLLSPAASTDLDEIWEYTAARWGVEQAERYTRELTTACQGLADKRLKGRAIDDVRAGYSKLSVGSHFLCYRLTDAGLTTSSASCINGWTSPSASHSHCRARRC